MHYTRLQPTDVDYNFRVITTLGRNPEVIDAEIRYQQKSNQPVNRATGAGAVRTDSLEDPELIERVHATAQKAVSAVYQHIRETNEPEALPDFIGVDLIPDTERNVYVLEVQCGPGGFGTLTSIDRQPLDGIPNVLIPAQMQALREPFSNRQPINPETLQRLPIHEEAAIIQYRAHCINGNNKAAERVLYTLATNYSSMSPENNLRSFEKLAVHTGHTSYALRYVNELLTAEPDNPIYHEYKTKFESQKAQP
jgi:hypothetical protein